MNLDTWLLFTLTVSYLTMLFVADGTQGPFFVKRAVLGYNARFIKQADIFDVLRRVLFVYEVRNNQWITRTNSWGLLWSCPKCLSFHISWIGYALWGYLYGFHTAPMIVLNILATSAVSTLLTLLCEYLMKE